MFVSKDTTESIKYAESVPRVINTMLTCKPVSGCAATTKSSLKAHAFAIKDISELMEFAEPALKECSITSRPTNASLE